MMGIYFRGEAPRSGFVLLYDHRCVVSAEAEGVAESSVNGTLLGFIEREIQPGIQFPDHR